DSMDVNKAAPPAWLNEAHPNYERWKRAREISKERGKFVESVLSKVITLTGLHILDLGSGEGGTAKVFSEKNEVVSFDINKERLQRQGINFYQKVLGDSENLPFNSSSFDVIILQDVIEHLQEKRKIINSLHSLLKKKGIIFISTPNKLSIFNVIADPHWGVPFISLLKRESIRKYFLGVFRKTETDRKDIAELCSLKNLLSLFEDMFEVKLLTSHSVKEVFKGNKGIVWSNFHLQLVRAVNKLKIGRLITLMANDKTGLINRFFTPTFYMILRSK
ncbi:MAG: class I SAM-dependent methyltransferase, partial [Ignavibacteria bacterium]|nr:class I SAM-dependent methyltransferase [Ignavibacteria bacterium]